MLIKHTLKYVSLKKPRLVVVENVKGLDNSRNHKFLNEVLNFFKKNDYMTWYQIVDTKCFLPHTRSRLFIVAIRADSYKHRFSWPKDKQLEPSEQKEMIERMIDPLSKTDAPFALPPRRGAVGRAWSNVRKAILDCKSKKVNVKHNHIIVDIDSSPKFSNYGVNQLRCLTATRARGRGHWILSRGRRISINEMFKFQGMQFADYQKAKSDSGISDAAMSHMLGNTVSLPCAEAVLGAGLWSAGLVTEKPSGRWVVVG